MSYLVQKGDFVIHSPEGMTVVIVPLPFVVLVPIGVVSFVVVATIFDPLVEVARVIGAETGASKNATV